MRTALIQGAKPAAFDSALIRTLQLAPEAMPRQRDDLHLGVRNEHGQVYRCISFRNLYDFLTVIARLRAAGYVDAIADPDEQKRGFDAVILPPAQDRARQRRAVPVAYAEARRSEAD